MPEPLQPAAPRSSVARYVHAPRRIPPPALIMIGLLGVLFSPLHASDPKPPSGSVARLTMNAQGTVTVVFPAKPAGDEQAVLRIKAGPLPRGAAIHATTTDGTLVAVVRPFGQNALEGTDYTFVVPSALLAESLRFTLHFGVHEAAGKPGRIPEASEVMEVSVFVSK